MKRNWTLRYVASLIIVLCIQSGCGMYTSAISIGATSGVLAAQKSHPKEVDPLRQTLTLLQRWYVQPVEPRQLFRPMLQRLKQDVAPGLVIMEHDSSLLVGCGWNGIQVEDGTLDADAFIAQIAKLEPIIPPCLRSNALVDTGDYRHAVIRAVLQGLDPHASLLLHRPSAGRAGIGVALRKDRDGTIIVDVYEGDPASEVGLRKGDRLLTVDGVDTATISLPEVIEKLQGLIGSMLTVTIARDEWDESHQFTLTRRVIMLREVTGKVLDGSVGYLKVRQFDEHTPQQIRANVKVLRGEPTDALVLDLRDNPGGQLTAAVRSAAVFLPPGVALPSVDERGSYTGPGIQSVKTADGFRTTYRADEENGIVDLSMVVLVNAETGAGAEIVADALQANHRAIVVGETTGARGTVQTELTLDDNTIIRFTTGTIQRVAGLPLSANPVVPDIVVEQSAQTESDSQLDRALQYVRTGR